MEKKIKKKKCQKPSGQITAVKSASCSSAVSEYRARKENRAAENKERQKQKRQGVIENKRAQTYA